MAVDKHEEVMVGIARLGRLKTVGADEQGNPSWRGRTSHPVRRAAPGGYRHISRLILFHLGSVRRGGVQRQWLWPRVRATSWDRRWKAGALLPAFHQCRLHAPPVLRHSRGVQCHDDSILRRMLTRVTTRQSSGEYAQWQSCSSARAEWTRV